MLFNPKIQTNLKCFFYSTSDQITQYAQSTRTGFEKFLMCNHSSKIKNNNNFILYRFSTKNAGLVQKIFFTIQNGVIIENKTKVVFTHLSSNRVPFLRGAGKGKGLDGLGPSSTTPSVSKQTSFSTRSALKSQSSASSRSRSTTPVSSLTPKFTHSPSSQILLNSQPGDTFNLGLNRLRSTTPDNFLFSNKLPEKELLLLPSAILDETSVEFSETENQLFPLSADQRKTHKIIVATAKLKGVVGKYKLDFFVTKENTNFDYFLCCEYTSDRTFLEKIIKELKKKIPKD